MIVAGKCTFSVAKNHFTFTLIILTGFPPTIQKFFIQFYLYIIFLKFIVSESRSLFDICSPRVLLSYFYCMYSYKFRVDYPSAVNVTTAGETNQTLPTSLNMNSQTMQAAATRAIELLQKLVSMNRIAIPDHTSLNKYI